MIVVDTSVWVDWFRGVDTAQSTRLDELLGRERIVTGDLILAELLQGFRAGSALDEGETLLKSLEYRDMVGYEVALAAAGNYRLLRARGITPRKTIDMLIATFCIRAGLPILHSDRDFDPCETYLGLQVVR